MRDTIKTRNLAATVAGFTFATDMNAVAVKSVGCRESSGIDYRFSGSRLTTSEAARLLGRRDRAMTLT